jgi:methionyl-tRNA synthetase
MSSFYVTTAIPYVNAEPHLGFALELVQADVLARYHRLCGDDTWFLTGTDENSLTNVLAAEREGLPVRALVDRNAAAFQSLTARLNISNDDFIRTATDPRHLIGAQRFWEACVRAGDVYRRSYRGLYCVRCERFYTTDELVEGRCPEHGIPPEPVEEENYFFRLSRSRLDSPSCWTRAGCGWCRISAIRRCAPSSPAGWRTSASRGRRRGRAAGASRCPAIPIR